MGGTQAWVEYVSLGLVKRGHRVTVIAERAPHDRRDSLESRGVTVEAFESPPDLDAYRRIVRAADAQVIHLNIWERFSELIRLREVCGASVALSYHSVPKTPWKLWAARMVRPSRDQWGMAGWFTLAEGRHFIDAHIGCCEASARGIRRRLWPFMQNKIFSLPNAIPMPEPISPAVLNGPLRFLQVGALNERKNPRLTLEAYDRVQKLLPGSSLTFVGDGPLYDDLANHIRERSLQNVALVGEVNDPSSYYMKSNILVLPSRGEGLPYTLLEGAGRGLPLIASGVDGNPEICIDGYNGILLKDLNVNILQKAMLSIAVNQQLRLEMSKNSRRLVQERFEIAKFVKRLENIYEVMIERNG